MSPKTVAKDANLSTAEFTKKPYGNLALPGALPRPSMAGWFQGLAATAS